MTRARQDHLMALLLRDGQWSTAATLADALGVTPRSIRSYVTALNARVPSRAAVESGASGYRAGSDGGTAARAGAGADAGTPRDRLHSVVRALLETPDGIDVFETADRLHVSPATVDADLARVRALLGGTELTLERSAERARLHGTERAQRRLLSRLAHDEMDAGSFDLAALRRTLGEGSVGARAFGPFKTDLVTELGGLGYFVNEFGITDVVMHIAIAADRVAGGRGLEGAGGEGQRRTRSGRSSTVWRCGTSAYSSARGIGSICRPWCARGSSHRVRAHTRTRRARDWSRTSSTPSARSSSTPPRSSWSTSRTRTSSSAWRCTCRTCCTAPASRHGRAIPSRVR